MEVQDKVAIITGGLGGIGFATVKYLLRNGVKFVGIIDLAMLDSDVVTNHLNELKREFTEDKFKYYKCDMRKITEFISCYDEIIQEKNYVDILINNAAVVNENDTDATVEINFTAIINNTMEAINRMNKLRSGIIVNIGSNFGLVNSPASMPLYNATKHAVVSFVRSMKEHNKTLGIRIVCLCPGLTKTNIIKGTAEEWRKKLFDFIDESFVDDMLHYHQQRPENVASAIIEIIRRGKDGDVWYAYKDEQPFAVGEETDVEKLRIPFS